MSDLNKIRAKLDYKIKDDAKFLSQAEKDSAISEALCRYSKDMPRLKFFRFSGQNKRDYDLPPEWVNGFSWIYSLEYPADQEVPNIVDRNDYIIFENDKGKFLKFLKVEPTKDEDIVIGFTIPHEITETTTTIPDFDLDAFIDLCASISCRMLATKFAQHSDSTIAADIVDYGAKVAHYNSLADNYQRLYREHVKGRELFGPTIGLAQSDWDLKTYWRTEFLFHRGEAR